MSKKHRPDKMARVSSLYDLKYRAASSQKYVDLAIRAARNLGGEDITTFDKAIHWLNLNASETSERGVVAEINFCR